MRQCRNACLWLMGQTIRVLKQTRKWYGPVAFCQGHTECERQWKKDWLDSPAEILAKMPLLLDRYGLSGWRIHIVVGGPGMIWKPIPLATADAAEARELIRGAGLLDEEGKPYGFDLACPEKNRDGLYDWIVGAYPADCIEALCRSVVDGDAVLASLDLLPAFLGGSNRRGRASCRSGMKGSSIRYICKTAGPWPMSCKKVRLFQKGLRLLCGREMGRRKAAPCRRRRPWLRSWNGMACLRRRRP